MSAPENLIDFDIIEGQKENIQSLPQGRSAKSLAALFSPGPLHKLSTPTPQDTKNLNDVMRMEYEAELVNIAESDDPLDIYDRYVRWTLDAYPSAQATPQSGLLPLLERATKSFLKHPQYKNDPRYLKLWLTYIRFFSDTPRETFAFLARHNIGESLALFYEEFASWLEGAGRWNQADEVYRMGIEREARPTPRLLRKYNEFQARLALQPQDTNGPSSPALPTVRPALAAKMDPFAPAAASPADPQAPRPSPGIGGSSTTKSGKPKLAIFSDDGNELPRPSSKDSVQGWESIGSLAERKKENTIEPKPWVGETLKAGGKKSSGPKMAIFKDQSLPIPIPQSTSHDTIEPNKEQVTVDARSGKQLRIFVNLEACYPNPEQPGTELCFEELRAASRGWLQMKWEPECRAKLDSFDVKQDKLESEPQPILDYDENSISPPTASMAKLIIHRDEVMVDENGVAQEVPRRKKLRTVEVNETQISKNDQFLQQSSSAANPGTVKTKLSSPSAGKKLKRKGNAEPTMTIHTKAATDDIYDLFNQPLKSEAEPEDEDDGSDYDDGSESDGDYTTSCGESTGTTRLMAASEAGDDETSDVKSVSEWSEFTARKHIPDINEEDDATRQSEVQSEMGDGQEQEDDEDVAFVECDDAAQGPQEDEEESPEPEEIITPIYEEQPHRTLFVPVPPEDYVAPTRPYRNPSQVSNSRLPFMTPIAEKTESSLGMSTHIPEKEFFNSRTPSKANVVSHKAPFSTDELMSSPFQEIVNESLSRPNKIPQPALVRSKMDEPIAKAAEKPHIGNGASRALAAKEIEKQKGPIITDAQCNPVDDYTRTTILQALQPPLSTYEGFSEHKGQTAGRTAELKKFAKHQAAKRRKSNDKTMSTITMAPVLTFPGTERQYMLKRELGAGAFAPVYLVESVIDSDDTDSSDEQHVAAMGKGQFAHFARSPLEALKMEDPPTPWEFYIMRQAKRRLGVSRAAESVIDAYEMHLFDDEGFLIEEYRDQGTLLDLINVARTDTAQVMDEMLVMFFAVELFRTVESLHKVGILHGDLKADNCVVRLDAIPSSAEWSSQYRRDGTGGWNRKGLALIDFGRGIDMKCFRPDVQFIADWKTSPQDCAEMRELRPWTYQIDYHGLAGIIHSMLFGKYIETVADTRGAKLGAGATKTYRLRESFKRYWQTEIWNEVFDLLLNPLMHLEGEEGRKLPVLRGMKRVRELMEGWLEGNCDKGVGLQGLLRRMESAVAGRRRP